MKKSLLKQHILTGFQAEKFLRKYIKVSESQLVHGVDKIKIKPPLVMKIISQRALHKTDIGGVRIVNSQDQIESNYKSLILIANKHNLKLDGIMVQKFYEGEQLIIGIKKDSVFNHIILFGIGGIFTEVLEDTTIRKCPINKYDAQEMIDDLRAKKIFYGFRGKKLNLNVLKNTLIQVSKIPLKHKTIKEMDINPFILNEKTGTVVDARIVFEN